MDAHDRGAGGDDSGTESRKISAEQGELAAAMRESLPPMEFFGKLDRKAIMGVGKYSRLNKKVYTKGKPREKGGGEVSEAAEQQKGPRKEGDKHTGVEVVAGAGLFASSVIKKGEIVWVDMPDEDGTWHIVEGTMDQFVRLYGDLWDEYEEYIYHERDNIYRSVMIGEEDKDHSVYLNHSCDPNVWYTWRDDLGFEIMEAMRDIPPGEELTIDYAVMEGGTQWLGSRKEYVGKSFDCCCKAPKCRGAVYVHDWKKPELQERYKGHFHWYLESLIAQLKE